MFVELHYIISTKIFTLGSVLSMQVGVRPQSGKLLLTTQFVTCYTNCVFIYIP